MSTDEISDPEAQGGGVEYVVFAASEGAASYDVFLGYSRADSAAAETLRARLKEADRQRRC
jgi:hypothetical protein